MPRVLLLLLLTSLLCTCGSAPEKRFERIVGIDFQNAIPENDSINILSQEYLYNGGGVGVGDFDGNGLPDLFFSGNYVSSRLYLQTKPWEFEDVTEAAGLTTDVWCAGVNVHDVNGDGRPDIYLATLNPNGAHDTPNRLYLNEGLEGGVPTFGEAATAYGLADPAYSTHSVWLDVENDGDLDLYLLNNGIEEFNRNVPKGPDTSGRAKSVDRLYRNENGRFTPENIKTKGWGLGVVAQDFNLDGYPDIYVANDFVSSDFMLINRGDGTFDDEIRDRLRHTSRNAMGVDVADLTGDGRAEIMTVDMLPDDNLRRKTMFGHVPHQTDRMERRRGYVRQYVRNTLQLANADGTYSDVAFQAGVAATDWSWAPLLADFNNDGRRDIFVSNGYPKDITNLDFADFSDQAAQFGTAETQLKIVREALAGIDGVHQPNYLFENNGDLSFSASDWLPDEPSYSNGAVFVDLDRDGDLDLVTNNLNEPVGLLRNLSREQRPSSTNYLSIDLSGPPGNPDGLGTKIWVTVGDSVTYHEQYRQRGYLSTVDRLVHVGLGSQRVVDEVRVRWPDGKGEIFNDVPANQILNPRYNTNLPPVDLPAAKLPVYTAEPLQNGPAHANDLFTDFDLSPLSVRDLSRLGPELLAKDIDDDGVDELIFYPGTDEPAQVWRQDKNGALTQVHTSVGRSQAGVSSREDGVNSQGRLPATTGGPEEITTKTTVVDTDGDGIDERVSVGEYLPVTIYGSEDQATGKEVTGTAGWHYSVTAVDLDGDGDQDLVVGNAGLNTPYRVDAEHPLIVRADDYDGNGTVDPLLFSYNGNVAYPVHPRNTLGRQLPSLKRQIPDFTTYGSWTIDSFPPLSERGVELRAVEFRSLYLENDGAGNFTARPLPNMAQTAPLRDALAVTLDDGRPALLCIQNDYAVEPIGGRLDAGTGFALYLDGDGELVVDTDYVSLPYDTRSIVKLRTASGEDMILVGINGGPVLQLVRTRQ